MSKWKTTIKRLVRRDSQDAATESPPPVQTQDSPAVQDGPAAMESIVENEVPQHARETKEEANSSTQGMRVESSCDRKDDNSTRKNSSDSEKHGEGPNAVASSHLVQKDPDSQTAERTDQETQASSVVSDQREPPITTEYESPWDTAYYRLKMSNTDLVNLYESILSRTLVRLAPGHVLSDSCSSSRHESIKNLIIQSDQEARQSQLRELLETWLSEHINGTDEDQEQSNSSLRSILRETAVSTLEATLPWLAACLALEMMVSPDHSDVSKEYLANLIETISRLPWSCNLATVMDIEGSEWKSELCNLYTAILSLELNLICLQHQISTDKQLFSSDSLHFEIAEALRIIEVTNKVLSTLQGQGVRTRLHELLDTSNHERDGRDSANSDERCEIEPEAESSSSSSTITTVDTEPRSESAISLDVPDPALQLKPVTEDEACLMDCLDQWVSSKKEIGAFLQWESEQKLMWVTGSSGTGKTALLKSTVRLMQGLIEQPGQYCAMHLSCFFPGGNQDEVEDSALVLKSLLRMIVEEQPSLKTHLVQARSSTASTHSDSLSDFLILRKVFLNILDDDDFVRTYIVIHSIHQCDTTGGRQAYLELLSLISRTLSISSKIKWMISSEQAPSVAHFSVDAETNVLVDLDSASHEPQMQSVIDNYIDYKAQKLALARDYSSNLQGRISQCIKSRRTMGSPHWVDLVCARLGTMDNWYALKVAEALPGDLGGLYSLFLDEIIALPFQDPAFCTEVLNTMAVTHHSINISEFRVLLEPRHSESHIAPVDPLAIAKKCSPFLEIGGGQVYFRHETARNYIRNQVHSESDEALAHAKLFHRCLDSLTTLSMKTDEVAERRDDNVAHSAEYASMYWIWHLHAVERLQTSRSNAGRAVSFLKTHFYWWLSALGSRRHVSIVLRLLVDLQKLFQERHSGSIEIIHTVRDACLLLELHLQLNVEPNTGFTESALATLLYAPTKSIIRNSSLQTNVSGLAFPPFVEYDWSDHRVLTGHTDYVRCLAFSPDGRFVASGSDDRTVRIWDARTGALYHRIADVDDWVFCLSISKEAHLALGTDDGTIDFWDIGSGRHYGRWTNLPGTVRAMSYSPNATQFAAAIQEFLYVWDLSPDAYHEQPQQGFLGEHTDWIRTVAFSPDGHCLISAGDSNQIKIWDPRSRHELKVITSTDSTINCVAFSQDGRYLASAADGCSRVWKFDSEDFIGDEIFIGDKGDCNAVAFSADGVSMAVGGNLVVGPLNRYTVRVWETDSWKERGVLKDHKRVVRAVAFSPTSGLLASSSNDGGVYLWEDGASIQSDQTGNSSYVSIFSRPVSGGIVMSSDESTIASFTELGETTVEFLLYDGSNGSPLMEAPEVVKAMTSLAISRDGSRLVTTSTDGSIKVFDARDGKFQHAFCGHEDWVRSAAISHDAEYVASASDDRTVRIWKMNEQDTEPLILEGHEDWVRCVAFSTDGRYLASGDDQRKVIVWEKVSTGDSHWELRHRLFVPEPEKRSEDSELVEFESNLGMGKSLAFSPDSKTLVVLLDDETTIVLWDIISSSDGIGRPKSSIKLSQRTGSIWFDSRSSNYVMADWGAVPLTKDCVAVPSQDLPAWAPYQISCDPLEKDLWILWKGEERILRTPAKYRPESSHVQGQSVILGCRSGHTILFRFSPTTTSPNSD